MVLSCTRHTSVVGDLPTGVVTFLLTDVVGSTELWDRAPDAMSAAVARHEKIVREAVAAEGGSVLKTKGEGDSTFSVFGRASDGLRAAYRLQQAMRSNPWSADARIRTRVAVHTGEAVEREGDYYGPAVNLVARLRSAAQGDHILVSTATVTIARRALPPGCDLVELGPLKLRGITNPEVAWALVAPDLDPIVRPGVGARRSRADGDRVSRREVDVHSLVREHLTNAEIASRLYISERTVESHVSSLLRKLGASDRRQLALHQPSTTWDAAATGDGPPRLELPAMLELLADPSTFVGREGERDLLRRQWQRANAGHTLLLMVSGEAGIGKSRLVSEFAAEIHAHGGRVLFGACYEDVDEPLAPFAQIMAGELAHLPEPELGRLDDREALARVSSEVARTLSMPREMARPGRSDVMERSEMYDAIERWLLATASTSAVLVVVEDLHWSTSSTRDLLRHLLRRSAHQRLLIVATTRDERPDLSEPLSQFLGELERLPAVTRLSLGGLDQRDIAALLQVSSPDAEAILAETGGNPLFVTYVAAAGHSGSLTALLARREALLDGEARALLDLAATFGVDFDAEWLAAGHGAPLLSVLESLERAEAAGLVVRLPGQRGRFGFVHALFRSHRYDGLPVRRRLELHASAAAALAACADNQDQLSELARHACLAVPISDARAAVDLAAQAALVAERAYAYEEAASHYQRGLEAARSIHPPDSRTSLDLTVGLAGALHRGGDAKGMPMLLEAAHRARHDGDTAALVRAATSLSHLGATSVYGQVDPEQVAVVEDALAALGTESSAMRAHLLVELAVQLGDSRVEQSVALADEAESIARAVDDAKVLGSVLLGARHVGRHPARLEQHLRRAIELEALGYRLRALVFTLAGLNAQTLLHLERGDLRTAFERGDRFLRVLDDRQLPFFQTTALVYQAGRAFLDGDLERAEELAMATVPFATSIRHPPTSWAAPTVSTLRRLQARDSELIAGLERRLGRGDETAIYRYVLPAVQARSGRTDDARHGLAELRSNGYELPKGYGWALAMSELAEAAELTDDQPTALHVLKESRAYSGRLVVSGPTVIRPVDQLLAQAALAAGDAPLAESYATRAVAASRDRHTPGFLARELVFLAEARRRTGVARGDLRALVDEAISIAEPIGLRAAQVDIERYELPG
jgi:class 3 adenylate cyclase/DNA-binding CsgD family transcriptional regulator